MRNVARDSISFWPYLYLVYHTIHNTIHISYNTIQISCCESHSGRRFHYYGSRFTQARTVTNSDHSIDQKCPVLCVADDAPRRLSSAPTATTRTCHHCSRPPHGRGWIALPQPRRDRKSLARRRRARERGRPGSGPGSVRSRLGGPRPVRKSTSESDGHVASMAWRTRRDNLIYAQASAHARR